MEILEKVRKYYLLNFEELDYYLEKTFFFDTSLNYPNSIVIKFGENKIIGEISVWNLDFQKYIEYEYVDLTKLENEPISSIKIINLENVMEKLIEVFDELKRKSNNNYR